MATVTMGDDGGDGGCGHGMHGVEASRVKRIMSAVEEAIRVRTVARVLQGLFSAGDSLEGEIECETVRECFGGEKRSFLRVGIFLHQADRVDCGGNCSDEGPSVHAAEDAVEAAKAGGGAEVRSGIGIRSEECGGNAHDGDSGKPVFAFGKLTGKEPDLLLIGQKVRGKRTKGNLAIGCDDR